MSSFLHFCHYLATNIPSLSMATSFQGAKTQHGHWLSTITVPVSPKTPMTFPNFHRLPFELQNQVWQYAAIPEQSLQFPAILDTDQILQTSSCFEWHRNSTAYFFAGQIYFSPAFLRGLETVRIHRNDVYTTLYAALWRRLSISSQYDVMRCLAQTCRLARLVSLKDIRASVEGSVGEDGDRPTIRTVKEELIGELDRLISGISSKDRD